MQVLKFVVLLLTIACAASAASGGKTTITGYIGSHKRSFAVTESSSMTSMFHAGMDGYIAITEVYPDVPGSAEYHYKVSADSYERRHRGIGFGPETYFVRVGKSPVHNVSLQSLSKAPFRILPVWGVTRAELDAFLANDTFRIFGTVPSSDDKGEDLVTMLAEGIPGRPEYHISTGFSAEIRYANRSPENVRTELENCAKWSRQYSIPAMLGLVSWWSGTPLRVPDGQGGAFGDVKYQQVCYAPNTEQPEDANLKALLGDRYSNHYCLSVPNEWSSTPWLTMNSKLLNDYRYKRIDEALAMLKEIGKGDLKWVDNIYLENEPRYWDTSCEAGNDKRHAGELWADFNPLAVAAAKRDGIDLNPADGLSNDELLWLFRNVGKYNQECVDAVNKSLRKHGITSLPVYTHSLQHRDMFPGGAIGHPASEWAYANGARTGVEGIWSQPSDFARIREWGRWANVNREENDGHHTDAHLWDLRVCYMMGGDLYNSYNWSKIGAQRVIDYVNEFLRELPVVTLAPAEAKLADNGSIELKTPQKLQAFDGLVLPVEVLRKGATNARLVIADKDGNLIGSSTAPIKAGKSVLAFEFATPVELPSDQTATLKLEVTDKQGHAIDDALRLTPDTTAGIKLSLDLRTQRALSLAVIAKAGKR